VGHHHPAHGLVVPLLLVEQSAQPDTFFELFGVHQSVHQPGAVPAAHDRRLAGLVETADEGLEDIGRREETLDVAALVYIVVVGVRLAWFFTTPYLHPVFDRLLRSRYLRAPWQERLVMSWSGMRGAVSLAAALAVPLSTQAGDPFPGRDLILFLTFSVISPRSSCRDSL
jgi:NhaP-type Na+/H+ or K+/H+ antiporter